MERPTRHLGNRLRMVRAARGLMQKDVAAQVGMTARHLSLLEHSPDRLLKVSSERVANLAQTLRVSTDYLLGLSDEVDLEATREAALAA